MIPQDDLGWSARKITISPNLKLRAGKQYVILLTSDTEKGCYGFAYNDSKSNEDEIASISKDHGETFAEEKIGL